MILVCLSFIALFFGASTCSPYDNLPKERLSADNVFNYHMNRIRRKRDVDPDQVVDLVKQGVEVAEKIHDVFNEIAGLKFDNFSHVIEVSKDGVEVLKEANEVGQQAYVIGKDVAYATKDFLDQHPEVAQAGKAMGTTLTQVSVYIGPALGGVGVAFAVISMVKGKEGTPGSDAISRGLQDVHERFDQISNQIEELSGKIDFYEAIKPYQAVRNSLENAYRDYLNVAQVPTSKLYRRAFHKACRSQTVEPLQALEKLHRIIVNPGPEDQPHMVESIINHYNRDYKAIMGWFERITVNAYTLATLRSACFGALHGSEDAGMAHTLNQTETWVTEIIQELARYEEKFTNIDPDFFDGFEKELESVYDLASLDSNAEKALNDVCNTVEKDWIGTSDVCLGDDDEDVNAIRVGVNNFLNTKYYWMNWLVVVYKHILEKDQEDVNVNPCLIGGDSKHFVHIKDNQAKRVGRFFLKKNVTQVTGLFVTWSRKDYDSDGKRDLAKVKLEEALDGYDPAQAEKSGTWKYGEEGFHFDVYGDRVNSMIGNWLMTVPGADKLFCHFEGKAPDYRRSIITSGVGYQKPQAASFHTVDTIIAFF